MKKNKPKPIMTLSRDHVLVRNSDTQRISREKVMYENRILMENVIIKNKKIKNKNHYT